MMATEIEHKYLVKNSSYMDMNPEIHKIRQGYLSRNPEHTVRVRIIDNKGFITIKGKSSGAKRIEFEYEIPCDDAKQLLNLCEGKIIDKTRYIVLYDSNKWEIDCFENITPPLTIAEIEIPYDNYKYSLPEFVGENVTGNIKYYNSNL